MAKVAHDDFGCNLVGPFGDDNGRYAFKLKTPGGVPFILVAKGSRLWAPCAEEGPILSIQKKLLVTAATKELPVVLAHCDPEKLGVAWYRVDPYFVLRYGIGPNMRGTRPGRPPIKMWNFNLRLIEPIKGPHRAVSD